jgi:hypothetical protein
VLSRKQQIFVHPNFKRAIVDSDDEALIEALPPAIDRHMVDPATHVPARRFRRDR